MIASIGSIAVVSNADDSVRPRDPILHQRGIAVGQAGIDLEGPLREEHGLLNSRVVASAL